MSSTLIQGNPNRFFPVEFNIKMRLLRNNQKSIADKQIYHWLQKS